MTESRNPISCPVPGVATAECTYPLSPLQEGLLFHRLLHERSDSYVLSLLFELSGEGQTAALLRALNKVIARHDVLRTSIQWEGVPRPMQTVRQEAVLPVERFELDPARDVREQLRERMKAAHHVLDLRQAPLARLMVAKDPHGPQLYAVLQVHHLVCDHQSLNIIAEEAIACIQGRELELPATRPYRHYVEQALADANTEEGRAFFRGKLADVDEPTAPFDLADVYGDGTRIEEASHALDADLVQGIRARARLMGVSSARLVHAAWAVVVARTSARSDIVYGTVVLTARQRGMQKERMLGMSVNTLPLRLRLADATAESLVVQTHQELAAVLCQEHTPLTVSLACSGVSEQTPLFTSLLNYRHTAVEHRTAPGTDGIRVSGRGEAWSNYPLAMLVDDCGDEIILTAQADRRIEAHRVIGYLETAIRSLLRALQDAPNTPAMGLAILPEQERQDVVTRFNSAPARGSRDTPVHELFERQVESSPDSTAVIHRDRRLSYAELNVRANRLAHHLLSSGVEPGEHVVLLIPRSIELVVAELAVLKAGCVYVPIDPEFPPGRQRFIVEDCGARRILSSSATTPGTLPAGVVCTDLRECESSTDRLQAANPGLRVSAGAVAYVMYTSGSTGVPKGVCVPHRAIHRLVIDNRYARIGAGDCIANCSNPAFDASTFEIWCALANGASMVVVEHDDLFELPRFAELLLRHRVTAMFMTVGLFNQCAVALAPVLRGLRYLLVGGDTLDSSIVGQVLASGPPQHLLNAYGPTETTTFATTHRISSDDVHSGRIPIGTPIADTQIYVLDESREPVPIGVTGEIHIGGAGVALGYLNRPELNQQRFFADCVTGQPGQLYRTGDLGRWRADGAVEFLGRNDAQVKVRGFRIELGEIEARLTQHASICNAAVVARNDAPGEKRLVAYVVANGDGNPDVEELRLHLAETLPEYMIPAAIVFLDRLPLTPNGKLDRKSLPAPQSEAYASQRYEAPRGEVEELLAEIWRALLHVERVGRLDNFFQLGGHSLLVVRLIDRLRRVGLAVQARRVFSSPTLAELARALQVDGFDEHATPPNRIDEACQEITPEMLPLVQLAPEHIERIVQRVPGGVANIQDIYPLAPLQEGILFHHLLSVRDADAYVSATLLSVSSRRRVEELLEALQGAVDRHDVLRTAIHWQHLPQPVQVVHRRAKLAVEEVVLDADRDALEQVEAWLEPSKQRLDLREPPLLRMRVARNPASSEWYVLLQLHHMVSDASSLHQVVSEVVAQMEGRAVHVAAPTPYRNHVAYALAHSRQHGAEAFFREKLAGIDESTAPFGLADTRGDGSHILESSEELRPELSQGIRSGARRMGVSAATLLHAAWALVVAHTSGRDDVVFGSVLLGRFHGGAGAASCLGMFINTLPVRLRIGGISAKDLVDLANQELLDLLSHEQAPLAMAQRCCDVDPATPLFTSLLNYRRDASDAASRWSRATGVSMLASRNLTNYPLALSVDDDGERFVLTAQADRRVDPRRVTGHVRTALESLVRALEEEPAAVALELPILPEHERCAVIEGFNSKPVPAEPAQLIHERFEAHARRTPLATAVTCEGQSLTYDELNRRANKLARHLRQFGAGPDRLVALCAERGLDLIVGVLGILKAGAAYVPLDPNYPTERLAYMLEDAQPQALVIEERLREKVAFSGRIVALDGDRHEIGKQPDGDLDSRALGLRPEHLAYVIYTSGSTGKPKGVMVEHRNVTRLVSSTDAWFGFGAADVWTLFHSIAFDFSVWEMWGALLYGGRVVVVPYSTSRSPRDFYRLLCDEGVTVLNQTPSAFAQLIDAQAVDGREHALRLVIFGGEALELRTLRPWVERNGAQRPQLVNMYGITETTVHVTYLPLTREQIEAERSSVIGGPIPDLRVYLLNQHRQPVPIGVVGEMYVTGAGVTRGYLRRPELTQERFMADPFCSDAGARMYKSGDLGRWRADGTLEYLGRNDDQVKIRGFRIEMGEIEAQLAAHPRVKEVAVIARTESTGDKRLVAYIVADGEAEVPRAVDQLRTHLRARLPDYMIPSAFVLLDRFPLTSNGKLDRRALPAPGPNACNDRVHEPPHGETEQALAAIWRELLQVDRVSREDSFFELGGHSLSAMQLMARIQSSLNVEASMELLFASPSLRQLSARLDELPRADLLDSISDSEADVAGLLEAVASMSEANAEAMLHELRTER